MTTIAPSTYVRVRSIGGSDAAAVMGESRYKTPAQIYDHIAGAGNPPAPEEAGGPTERGRALEDLAAQLYERKTGRKTFVRDRSMSETHPFLHATPDRIAHDEITDSRTPYFTSRLVEIKCPGSFVLRGWKEEGIPREYYIQIQHYLFVLGLERADFVALDYDAWDVWIVPVERDEVTIARIVDACTRFWLDHVEAGVRPAEPERGAVRHEPEWPKGRPGKPVTRDDPEWVDAVRSLQMADEQLKLAEHARELAVERVKTLMGEQEKIVGGGSSISWAESTSRTLDVKALQAAHPEIDYEAFARVKATRSFRATHTGGKK